MSEYRFEFVKRNETHTGNEIDCLHVIISNNSNRDIADTHIPLDDILEAATVQGYMTIAPQAEQLQQLRETLGHAAHQAMVRYFNGKSSILLQSDYHWESLDEDTRELYRREADGVVEAFRQAQEQAEEQAR